MPRVLNTFGFLLFVLISKGESIKFEQSSSQIVKEGTTLRINCSHDDSSLQVMLWYQSKQTNRSMSLIGYTVLTSPPNYEGEFKDSRRFQIKRDDTLKGALIIQTVNPADSAVYFCAASMTGLYDPAYFGSGTRLTVLERDPIPPKVKVFKPSPKECRNKNKTLVCVASKFYPDHVSVSWKLNGENINKSVATDNNALKQDDGSYTITSRLRVSAEKWYTPDNNFTCTVHFNSWNHTVDESASVSGVEAPGGRNITRDHYLRVTNAAKLSYGVFIAKSCIYGAFVAFLVWKLQGSTGKQNN